MYVLRKQRVYPSFSIMKQPSDGALVHHALLKMIVSAVFAPVQEVESPCLHSKMFPRS